MLELEPVSGEVVTVVELLVPVVGVVTVVFVDPKPVVFGDVVTVVELLLPVGAVVTVVLVELVVELVPGNGVVTVVDPDGVVVTVVLVEGIVEGVVTVVVEELPTGGFWKVTESARAAETQNNSVIENISLIVFIFNNLLYFLPLILFYSLKYL